MSPRSILALAVAVAVPSVSSAAIVYTALSPALVTVPNPGGGNNDGTGIWFNPLTGYNELRGFFFPNPLFEDGKFFLLTDTSSGNSQAQVFVEGLFSRGNGVVYTSSTNLNTARFAAGDVINSDTGFQSPGAGFGDLGPAFGNWPEGGQGFIGLIIRDPSSSSRNDVFYGFADITINPDTFFITLNAFGYNNVRGEELVIPVPFARGDFGGNESTDGSFNTPDGAFDGLDIEGFLLALNNQSAYLALNPSQSTALVARGDFGGNESTDGSFNSPDGAFDGLDIEGFLLALNDPSGYAAIQPPASGGLSAIPEPAALTLLAPLTLLLPRRRPRT